MLLSFLFYLFIRTFANHEIIISTQKEHVLYKVAFRSTSLTHGEFFLALREFFLAHVAMTVCASVYTPQAVWLGGCNGHFYTHIAGNIVGIASVPAAVPTGLSGHPFHSIVGCVRTASQKKRI